VASAGHGVQASHRDVQAVMRMNAYPEMQAHPCLERGEMARLHGQR
jgi:hypothetical protein